MTLSPFLSLPSLHFSSPPFAEALFLSAPHTETDRQTDRDVAYAYVFGMSSLQTQDEMGNFYESLRDGDYRS
jgi:hypothetical protein